MTKKLQQIASCVFGIVFLGVLLALAMVLPNPTIFQYTVFRVVLALAAAGVAAMIPGFLEVTIQYWIRAGGALAIFVLIYFFNPAALVNEITSQSKHSNSPDKHTEKTDEAPKRGQANTVPTSHDKKSVIQKSDELLLPIGDLVWQKNIETNILTWPDAQEYCKSLEISGFDDWRLPTISELESFVDKSHSPPINSLFGALPNNYLPYFWSSTIDPNDDHEAQFLNFKNGLPAHINKEKKHGFVRCVRHV